MSVVAPDHHIDTAAWNVIQHWHDHVPGQTVYDGIDYADLVKWYLWDKVGAFYRSQVGGDAFAFEQQLAPPAKESPWLAVTKIKLAVKACRKELQRHADAGSRGGLANTLTRQGQDSGKAARLVFIPFPTPRTQPLTKELIAVGYRVVTNDTPAYLGSRNPPERTGRAINRLAALHRAGHLSATVATSLAAQGVPLPSGARHRLLRQLFEQQRIIQQAEAEINAFGPDCLLLHGDNHSPYQEYVAVAHKYEIPTVTFQHGLECERYYLDKVFATHYAVWSRSRHDQIRVMNPARPVMLAISGNPAYDQCQYPRAIDHWGRYWLWLTRPHRPRYCYAPSRQPREGVDIFNALVQALVRHPHDRLVIKPHPNDYADVYRDLTRRSPCMDRIEISSKTIGELVPDARLVISEDSTAGVEAMFSGKIIVHAHFAMCQPVLKLTDFAAALPGFATEQLIDSLGVALSLDVPARQRMLDGQIACLDHYAGPLDGHSGLRQREFLLSLVGSH